MFPSIFGLRSFVTTCLLCAVCTLSACGSGGSDQDELDALAAEYGGTWDVRYNLTVDECGVVDGVVGIADLHTITQDGNSLTLQTPNGPEEPFTGAVREDNSFLVEQLLEGDIFNVGLFCTLRQQISYQATSASTASSLYERTITCADGYLCNTHGVGESKRRAAL